MQCKGLPKLSIEGHLLVVSQRSTVMHFRLILLLTENPAAVDRNHLVIGIATETDFFGPDRESNRFEQFG